jgi:hypothetical protein
MFPPTDFAAPPSLSKGFGDCRSHQLAAVFAADDLDDLDFDDLDALPSVRPNGGVEKFRRRHQVGEIGVGLILGGYVSTAAGVTLALVGSLNDDVPLMVGGSALGISGAIGVITGEVMLFDGGIGAANALGLPATVGWVGVGLVIGGSTVGLAWEPATYLALAGLVCGAIQLGQTGHEGRRRGYFTMQVAPMPEGVALAGTF